jgi:hypothetical protein
MGDIGLIRKFLEAFAGGENIFRQGGVSWDGQRPSGLPIEA